MSTAMYNMFSFSELSPAAQCVAMTELGIMRPPADTTSFYYNCNGSPIFAPGGKEGALC